VAQCFELTRTRTLLSDRDGGGEPRTATGTVYGITSLRRDQADAARLLSVVREHWGDREQGLPRPRPDAGGGRLPRPHALGPGRLLHPAEQRDQRPTAALGVNNRAAQLRTFCADPVKALEALHQAIPEN
jgi:hypothetical protein